MGLKITGIYSEGEVNDVCICRNPKEPGQTQGILWIVKSREAVKVLAEMKGLPCQKAFAGEGGMCYLFPYRELRPVERFFQGQDHTFKERKEVCRRIVSLCMTEPVSYPVLYLLLKQRQVQIDCSGQVYFTYLLKLEELEADRFEVHCVRECLHLLLELMEGSGTDPGNLIKRKQGRDVYRSFAELYRDLDFIQEKRKRGPAERLREYAASIDEEKKLRFVKIFLRVTAVLAAVAVILLISRLVFGDFPLFRLFGAAFEQIGTQSLRQ